MSSGECPFILWSYLDYRRPTEEDLQFLADWLLERALEHEDQTLLISLAVEKLKAEKLVRPALYRLVRMAPSPTCAGGLKHRSPEKARHSNRFSSRVSFLHPTVYVENVAGTLGRATSGGEVHNSLRDVFRIDVYLEGGALTVVLF